MANVNLSAAKKAKNDEFYTQYADIEKEMNAYLEYNEDAFRGGVLLLPCDDPEWSNFTKYFVQNFDRLGLKKLISTSYAPNSKPGIPQREVSELEKINPKFDPSKSAKQGRVLTLERDLNKDGRRNFEDLEWDYLEGDGSFMSHEVIKLREEATHVVTNPPFSLFKEFLAWVIEGKVKFSIIGNVTATSYREVFPLIKSNKMWWGASPRSMTFSTPEKVNKNINSVWFTNIEHGIRQKPIKLMTEKDNLRFNKALKGSGYRKYDNYDAIEVPRVDAIPSDYKGIMGVPITFLSKYSPSQFEIIWQASGNTRASAPQDILELLNYKKTQKTVVDADY